MKKQKGFTLIELLVVISIIALLLAILIPGLKKAKEVAKRAVEMSGVRQIGIGVNLYADTNDGKIMPYSNSAGVEIDVTLPADGPAWQAWRGVLTHTDRYTVSDKLKAMHLGLLYEEGILDNPEIFYCPSQPRNGDYPLPYNYDHYIGNGTVEWGSQLLPKPDGSADWAIRTSYNYYTHRKKKLSELRSSKAIVFDNIQEWEVVPHRKNSSSTSKPQGLAALFADGHVSFVTDAELFSSETWNNTNVSNGSFGDGPGNDSVAFLNILRILEGK